MKNDFIKDLINILGIGDDFEIPKIELNNINQHDNNEHVIVISSNGVIPPYLVRSDSDKGNAGNQSI